MTHILMRWCAGNTHVYWNFKEDLAVLLFMTENRNFNKVFFPGGGGGSECYNQL